ARDSGAAVDRALVGREEQRHVVVAAPVDRDRHLDLLEEAGLDVEDEAVFARSEGLSLGQVRNAPVLVRLLERDQLVAAEEADPDPRPRLAGLRVEDVRRDHGRHLLRGAPLWTRKRTLGAVPVSETV